MRRLRLSETMPATLRINRSLPMSPTPLPTGPLHAHDEDIERYADRFAAGWDQLRFERLAADAGDGHP